MQTTFLIIATVIIMSLSGCTAITRGSSQKWTVRTEPTGANVHLSTGQKCITPCTLKLKRTESFSVTIDKQGYKAVNTQIISDLNIKAAQRSQMSGLIAYGIDGLAGSNYDLTPSPLIVILERNEK
jgi:hypothetical protein